MLAYSYIKNFVPKEDFVCIINGLSGYYFICKYSCNGEKLTDEKMVTKEDIYQMKNLVGLEEEEIGEIKITPTAQQLILLANEKREKGVMCSAREIVPLYLRKSQAECGLENKK